MNYCHTCRYDSSPKELPCRTHSRSDGQLCTACNDLNLIEEEVVQAKLRLDELVVRRAEMRSKCNLEHDAVVHHLPTELISNIFISSIAWRDPEQVFMEKRPKPWNNDTTTPNLLSSVCRNWRSIAGSTPQIWTYIRFALDNIPSSQGKPSQRCWSDFLEIALDMISRSGSLPIHFTFVAPKVPIAVFKVFETLVRALYSQSRRWGSAYFNTETRIPTHFFKIRDGHFDILQRLAIWGENGVCLPPSPRLSWVKVGRPNVKGLSINWANITEFHLDGSYDHVVRDLLPKTPRLRKLVLGNMRTNSGPPRNANISHLALEELIIYSDFCSMCLSTFGFLPALSSCTFMNMQYSIDVFRHFLPLQSRGHITSLALADLGLDINTIINALSLIPTLQTLSYRRIDGSEMGLIKELIRTKDATETPFLPNLQGLLIEAGHPITTSSWSRIVLLIPQSDSNLSGRPLRSIRICFRSQTVTKATIPSEDALSIIQKVDPLRCTVYAWIIKPGNAKIDLIRTATQHYQALNTSHLSQFKHLPYDLNMEKTDEQRHILENLPFNNYLDSDSHSNPE